MNIIQKLIPTKYKRIRPGKKMNPSYITVHETSNRASGANASAHARLLSSGNDERVASWHYTIDQDSIYQHLPTSEVAYHAGNRTGNYNSIGIEICVNKGADFNQAKVNAVQLIRDLMQKHNIPISRVVPHKHWTGKQCPANLLKSWNSFIHLVKNSDTQPAPYDNNPEYHRLLALYSPMMRGADVKRLQQRLQSKVIDGIFGPATESDVLNWQRLHDEKGNVVKPGKGLVIDGVVGAKTWNALFK